MQPVIAELLYALVGTRAEGADVLEWASPVPAFGDPASSTVATLGLNPSNREFVTAKGGELDGVYRRFYTLQSLGIDSWSEANAGHVSLIAESCRSYFLHQPYDSWFRRLEPLARAAGASFYHEKGAASACHLDLVPFATRRKWSNLSIQQRRLLYSMSGSALARLLADSGIEVLILNGRGVAEEFQSMFDVVLECRTAEPWSLPGAGFARVKGLSYRGIVGNLGGLRLQQPLLVLGYNHNIQSSFGVTSTAVANIARWIGRSCERRLI